MKLKLLYYRAVRLSIEPVVQEPIIAVEGQPFDLRSGTFYPDGTERILGIGFMISFSRNEYSLKAEMRFFFETDSPITEEFKSSSFPSVNAPAIAFPYLRSFISTVTLQAGYSPEMLPSINFVEVSKNQSI